MQLPDGSCGTVDTNEWLGTRAQFLQLPWPDITTAQDEEGQSICAIVQTANLCVGFQTLSLYDGQNRACARGRVRACAPAACRTRVQTPFRGIPRHAVTFFRTDASRPAPALAAAQAAVAAAAVQVLALVLRTTDLLRRATVLTPSCSHARRNALLHSGN